MAHARLRATRAGWLGAARGASSPPSRPPACSQCPEAAYSATKHAALAHAEWLSMTYGGRGITVQAVCPLGVRTDLVDLSRPQTAIVLGHTPHRGRGRRGHCGRGHGRRPLPHPAAYRVAGFYAGRAADTDRWLAGMRRISRPSTLPSPGPLATAHRPHPSKHPVRHLCGI